MLTNSPKQRWIQVLQHVADEGPGRLRTALELQGFRVRVTRIDRGEPVPTDLEDAVGLVVLGGPMGVYEADTFPHLHDEMRLIERALATDVKVLGICLGSQLLAHVLGARVHPGTRKEIGWYPVTLEPAAHGDRVFGAAPSSFHALHWHGDVFDLPRESVHLAHSEVTTHQAFRHGENAYGLLFHLEADVEQVTKMRTNFASELVEASVDGDGLVHDSVARVAASEALAAGVFARWASIPGPRVPSSR